MFSSAPKKDQWGPRFDSPPSTSTTASQANATGRKRKANFSNDETETLVWNVVRHFSALYGSESFRAHPVRRKQLWTQIQSRVNFLGYTERSIDDLKHKWRDLRLDVKKKITAKKPPALHRPGPPHKPRLTPLEKMVASTFLQPTHDSEPEIILDPEIFFPGASKPSLLPMPPGVSHPSIYIDTNGQPSSLPDMESSPAPSLGVQNPDPSMVCDYSRGEGQSSSESGPDLRTPDRSAVSPPTRNESLVSYESDEEEREGHKVDGGGLEPLLLAEEDGKVSGRKAVLIHRCGSQGSVVSVLEETLGHGDPHSDWGNGGPSDIPLLDRGLDSSQPEEEEERDEVVSQSTESGPLPQRPMGSTWEKEDEEQQPQHAFSAGALTEESLPSSASPQVEQVSRGIGASHQHETWRTPLHRLMDMEDQWDQLYHHELATWQEERAQQREERARDRELQFRLLAVLTDIRDELRHLREERAAARPEKAAGRQEQASQTMVQIAATESAAPKPEGAPPVVPPETPSGFPLKTEGVRSGPSPARAVRGEAATVPRSPHGVSRRGRGRGRPRGSMSKHKRFLTNSS